MSLLSLEELREIVEQPQSICVSLFMPTVKRGSEMQQNPIRFKNLIKQAEAKLAEHDLRSPEIASLLQPAMDLDSEDFWQHQDEGLAVFVTGGFCRYYRLPLPFEELVVVNDRFHLKPLLPLLTRDSTFYILALSQKQVRFFEASRYNIHEVEVPNLPQNLNETLQYDETAKDGQFRIGTTAGHGGSGPHRAGTFHGQGSPDRDQHQKDILQFFLAVDGALQDVLRNQQATLILASVEYLRAIYQEANTYHHLLPEGIDTENPQVVTPEELHQRALPLVEPLFSQSEQAAIDHYQEMTSTGKTSTDPKEAIPAAYYGRIEQLFVPVGVQRWGNFDPQTNELQIHPDAEPGDEDLLNAAAIQTLLNGGEVYAVEPDRVPDEAPLAAVFRY
jgi:hypothetical protein